MLLLFQLGWGELLLLMMMNIVPLVVDQLALLWWDLECIVKWATLGEGVVQGELLLMQGELLLMMIGDHHGGMARGLLEV